MSLKARFEKVLDGLSPLQHFYCYLLPVACCLLPVAFWDKLMS